MLINLGDLHYAIISEPCTWPEFQFVSDNSPCTYSYIHSVSGKVYDYTVFMNPIR